MEKIIIKGCNRGMRRSILLALLAILFGDFAIADPLSRTELPGTDSDIKFSVKPNKCISLHKGQTCFQKVLFTWTLPEKTEYCLYSLSTDQALICWQGGSTHSFAFDFQSIDSETFQIRASESAEILAETTIKRAWVYRSERKSPSNWRLF